MPASVPSRTLIRGALTLALPFALPLTAGAQRAPTIPLGTFLLIDGYGGHQHRTFLPGNLVYRGVPTGGPEAFGPADARAGDPRELGTYTRQGSTMVIVWGGGAKPETTSVEVRPGEVRLDGTPYLALRRYPANHRLDGRYTTRSYNRMGVAGGGSLAWGGAGTVVFHPDGTFDYGRAGMATSTAGGASASGTAQTGGRYVIGGNTVTFTFPDGRVQRALIHPWAGEETARTPTSVNLNGRTYTKE